MSEPTTQAGRDLIASLPTALTELQSPEYVRHVARRILAIEREARDYLTMHVWGDSQP